MPSRPLYVRQAEMGAQRARERIFPAMTAASARRARRRARPLRTADSARLRQHPEIRDHAFAELLGDALGQTRTFGAWVTERTNNRVMGIVDGGIEHDKGGGCVFFAKGVVAQEAEGGRLAFSHLGKGLFEHAEQAGGLFIAGRTAEMQPGDAPRKDDLDMPHALALREHGVHISFKLNLRVHLHPLTAASGLVGLVGLVGLKNRS